MSFRKKDPNISIGARRYPIGLNQCPVNELDATGWTKPTAKDTPRKSYALRRRIHSRAHLDRQHDCF